MGVRTLSLTDKLYDYMISISLRENPVLKKLRINCSEMEGNHRQISPEQGQLMALLAESINAKKTLDIGTFRGYSALAIALAIPDDGLVVTCDIVKEWADIARVYWEEAGVHNKISLHLRPALETLDELISKGESNSFDFAFIDADKTNHHLYYEKVIELVRTGGIIVFDNVFWEGLVADTEQQDEYTNAVRNLNAKLYTDDRISISTIPISDGITIARKR